MNDFEPSRDILIKYLKMKAEECDWHAVSDAANDLRVLEASNAQEIITMAPTKEFISKQGSNK